MLDTGCIILYTLQLNSPYWNFIFDLSEVVIAMTQNTEAPARPAKMPKAMSYILINEVSERYAFYAMMAILNTFLLKHLSSFSGNPANLSEADATAYVSFFQSACYLMPLVGSIISDMFWGKFKTIIIFSIVYCVGFLAITLDQTYLGAIMGLSLIATGTGIIKPCVSANVGDQFDRSNQQLLSKAYNLFYWSVNIGATLSMFLSPILLDKFGPKVAFGTSGVFMGLATLIYALGYKQINSIPAQGSNFLKETFSKEGLLLISRLFVFLFMFVAVFWALFNQTMSKWVSQAYKMDLTLFNWNLDQNTFWGNILGSIGLNQVNLKILPEQIQAVNSLLVVIAIPLFAFVVYPLIDRVFKLTPLRKVAIGFFIAIPSFIIPAIAEGMITRGQTPSCWLQILAYVFITAGEVMISIPALEFAYTQAPKSMKSFISSLNLLSISLGSLFVALLNIFIQNEDKTVKLEGASYYWFFAILLAVTAVVFSVTSRFYKGKTYIQE
jgi:POT family proton-dependent oligopeptide transporter